MSSKGKVLPVTELGPSRWLQRTLWLTFASLLFGCGYGFEVEGPGPRIGSGTASDDGRPLVRLVIRDFINRTLQRNLEFKYATFMRQELTSVGGAKIVPESAQADFIFKGEIVSVVTSSLAFSGTQTQEGRVNVVVRVTVEDQKTGRIVWGETATGTGEFFVNEVSGAGIGTDELQTNQVLRDRALEQAGRRVAESLADDFWLARDQGIFDARRSPAPNADPVSPTPGIS